VKDSGIGINEEQQSKIFDAFSQADASTSRKFGGTGLGLTISSKLVNLMGGKLDIESVEGEGTTFFFSIALKKSEKSLTRIKPNLEHLNVAYLSIGDGKKIDGNLDAYVKYGGASFKTYSYQEILDEGDALLADIIFVERKAIKSDMEMKALLELNRKIVILTTTEMMSCNSAIKEKISKVIYKPVNLSKTLLALNVAESSSVVVDKKVKRVNNIKSNKVFTGVKALVAEDNLINQKLIKNILNRFDISVTLVENGAEAFDAYTKGQYNIIFMDIQMPIMSGVEATEKIIAYEKESGLRHIPIVALTANVIESDKEKYLKSGMDRYLKKPIDVKELVAVIENLFPINELRDSLVLEEQEGEEKSSLSTIILYKETELTGKIYSAVLNNLGYKVDVYSEENEFLEQLDSKEYSFALFDAKPFKTINSDRLVIDLIRDSGATPIAFVEKETPINYCATLNPIGTVKEIEYKLLCS
jgi:CheY-like chemotaxis protein